MSLTVGRRRPCPRRPQWRGRAAISSGLGVYEFAPRLSFFFVARIALLEEVAEFRAARRLWARIMREKFGAVHPRSRMQLRHLIRDRYA